MIFKAIMFATIAHNGQLRKYTNEPYIMHPLSVAHLVHTVTDDMNMLVAAILHDVEGLTDPSVPEDGNRQKRRTIDLNHTAMAHPKAKTIKLADIIHNTVSIVQHDKEFAKIYMAEKKVALDFLTEGDPILLAKATKIINDYHTWEAVKYHYA